MQPSDKGFLRYYKVRKVMYHLCAYNVFLDDKFSSKKMNFLHCGTKVQVFSWRRISRIITSLLGNSGHLKFISQKYWGYRNVLCIKNRQVVDYYKRKTFFLFSLHFKNKDLSLVNKNLQSETSRSANFHDFFSPKIIILAIVALE